MGESSVKLLVKNEAITGLPASYVQPPYPLSTDCLPCIQSKTQAQPHPPVGQRADDLLAMVVLDLVGPLPPGLRGERYWLTIVDVCSRYGCTIPMRTKDEAKRYFLEWVAYAQLKTGRKLKHVHGDRGGEFLNTFLLDHFRGKGVEVTFSNPHTPQQNGIAEARNKQVGPQTKTPCHGIINN